MTTGLRQAATVAPAERSRTWLLACAAALAFALLHLMWLPPTLEDLDAINFAMGVRDFDVARHQPHPPGYPVFVALGKLTTAALAAAGMNAPEARGLAVLGALGGGVVILFAFLFFSAIADDRQGAAAAVLLAASPLLWFTSLRPLSDVPGLAAAFAALAPLAAALRRDPGQDRRNVRLLVLGACAAGVAAGFRSQTAVLTMPLLAFALIDPRMRLTTRDRLVVMAAAAAGVAAWGIPLLIASGGFSAYLRALGSQAGEDFSGVEMLWTNRTPRVAVFAILHSFVLPWDSPVAAGFVLALAAAGTWLVLRRSPRALLLLALAFGPYTVFHLLFQETVTVRYALPLVPAVCFLAAAVLVEARAIVAAVVLGGLVVFCLGAAVPAGMAFGRDAAPIFALLSEMRLLESRGAQPLVAFHRRIATESRRARQWAGPPAGTLLPSPRDFEWLELTRRWREGSDEEAWFVADPRRTDLALIDAEHRRSRTYRWPFDRAVYVGGARPDEIDWHIYRQPGWFLEQGWALTPEIAGITERDGWGPHRKPSVGWIRRRAEEAVLMIGGRHLGGPSEPAVRIIASVDDRPLATIDAKPGYFLQIVPVPAGALAGNGYARLTVTARPSADGSDTPRVAIEQFNIQSAGVVLFGFGDGWYEPELNPRTARSWRWASDAAALRIQSKGDVRIRISAENPRRYFDRSPRVWITAGDRTLAEAQPAQDFTIEAVVPGDVLQAAGGVVTLHSSETFVAGEREGTADRRRLALRIYAVDVR